MKRNLYVFCQMSNITNWLLKSPKKITMSPCRKKLNQIRYQFNKKSTLQLFFSIISFGYSGTTFCYTDPDTGKRYNEHTNDIIVFSGRLRNLLSNQFTPGLYGLKFGVQKNF